MTSFELSYLAAEPFLQPLYQTVRKTLLALAREKPGGLTTLDVGGRKSHYTIGVPMRVFLSDLPRKSHVQERLHLGVTNSIAQQVLSRRSNIRHIVFDDMTRSSLKSESFDCVVAVEVLEHVVQDADFVREVYRVLKPNGYFVMTTPNGDAVVNTNPDHQRHYTHDQLASVLGNCFQEVRVDCAVIGGRFHRWGLHSWSGRRPFTTAMSMAANVINSWQSSSPHTKTSRTRTRHLIAVAKKVA